MSARRASFALLLVVPLLLAPSGCSSASRNERAVARAFEDWQRGTGSPIALLAPEATWTVAGSSVVSRRYGSRQAFLDQVAVPLNKRFSKPLVPTVRGTFADGDTVVVLFDAEGTARDGQAYRNTYTWYLRFEGEQVIDVVAMFDPRPFDELWQRVQP